MTIDFQKMNGLVPAIIQDAKTLKVLMLGFMNEEAYQKTVETGKVTFFSRTRNTLWTKGRDERQLPQCCQHRKRLRQRHSAHQG